MSITSVLPPSSTPAGWFGCFGPPLNVDIGVPTAWLVLGQAPCGNGTVASCCIFGDQCLSNGVCQILPIANNGQDASYYGAYCTDPTFTSPECTSNCAVEYMAYCGYNDIWQCGDTDRNHPLSCNLSETTVSQSSTFFMIEPSKLAKGLILQSTEPSTTQTQYIPTQWGVPTAQSTTSSTSFTFSSNLSEASTSSFSTSTNNPSSTTLTSPPSSTTASDNTGLSHSDKIAIGMGLGIGIPTIIISCLCAYFGYLPTKKRGPKLRLRVNN